MPAGEFYAEDGRDHPSSLRTHQWPTGGKVERGATVPKLGEAKSTVRGRARRRNTPAVLKISPAAEALPSRRGQRVTWKASRACHPFFIGYASGRLLAVRGDMRGRLWRGRQSDWSASMKMGVSTAVVLTLTMLLLAPLQVKAGGHGGGGGAARGGGHLSGFGSTRGGFFNGQFVNGHNTFGFVTRNAIARRHFGFRHRNNFDNFALWWPWGPLYGSYGVPYTDDDYSMGYQTPQTVKSCEHSEKTYTVPSANGGTADVTILRC
jgi:hypothetical protein